MKYFQCAFCRALQEAQDIFGVDFDFEEFEQYDDDYNEEEEEEEEVSSQLSYCHACLTQ